MIIDKQLELSDAQLVTASAASENYIDMGAAGDAYVGMFLVLLVAGLITADGAATVQFALQCDDNSSFSSPTTLWESAAIAKATLVDGYKIASFRIPKGCERYLRVYYTVATGPLTLVSAFDAFLSPDEEFGF